MDPYQKFDFDLYILQDMILGFIIGWSLIFTISNLYCLIRKEQGFGSGDKWLLGALGLWFGDQVSTALIELCLGEIRDG